MSMGLKQGCIIEISILLWHGYIHLDLMK